MVFHKDLKLLAMVAHCPTEISPMIANSLSEMGKVVITWLAPSYIQSTAVSIYDLEFRS